MMIENNDSSYVLKIREQRKERKRTTVLEFDSFMKVGK